MKKILGMALVAAMAFTACNESSEEVLFDEVSGLELTQSVDVIVSSEATIDAVVEATDYEIDFFSTASTAIAGYDVSLKSGPFCDTGNPLRFGGRYKECPTVTIESENGGFPRTITLDYGERTELSDGRIISGIMQVVISDRWNVDGSTRTISFIDFVVDSIGIEGAKTIVRNFEIGVSKAFTMTSDMTFTLTDGTVINRTAEKIRSWVAGLETELDPADDVIEITGYCLSVDSEGNAYRKEITTELKKTGMCRWIVSGVVTMTQNEEPFAFLDYGDGTCDNVAVLTHVDGTTEEITLGRCKRRKK